VTTIAFFSYARHDDKAVNGLLSKIRENLEVEVRVRAGNEDLEVFQDTDDIDPGDIWETKLREAIDNSAFFIPVITPFYFTRQACRKELETWLTNYRSDSERKKIVPIKFLPLVSSTGNGSPNDKLRKDIEKIQHIDFQPFRSNRTLKGRISIEISRLADRIVQLL
jgi:hypothetical protein